MEIKEEEILLEEIIDEVSNTAIPLALEKGLTFNVKRNCNTKLAAALPGPPASADLRFYPVAPRPAGENAAAAATASDAYLRTLRTVKGRAGLYGE